MNTPPASRTPPHPRTGSDEGGTTCLQQRPQPAPAPTSGSTPPPDSLTTPTCALHTAHQTHVDAWIAAANRKLAETIIDHLAAAAEHRRSDRP